MHQMDKVGQLLPQCGGPERAATQMSPLGGIELPRRPQITPSESCWASQKKADAPVASSSAPVMEASVPQGATSDAPAPMEMGGAGDGQSWVEQAEAEDDFKRDRPMKRRLSQSRRWEDRPTLPFLLQDDEGRCTSTQELYRHAGQQPPAHHNVATVGITHLHPEVLLHEARSLGNQVLCMIAEYHLTSNAQGSLSLSPVLPERFAASYRGLHREWCIPGNKRREGCRKGQDPPNCHLAELPRHAGGGR